MKTNKYNYLKVIQQNYGQGWEDVSEYETNSQGITFQLVAVAKIQDYFSKHKTVIKFCPNNSSIN